MRIPEEVALMQSTDAVCPDIVVASWAGTSKALGIALSYGLHGH